MSKVCILNYGSGNVRSVFNIVSLLSNNVVVSNSKTDIKDASHLIFPGVGAFGASMGKIKNTIDLGTVETEVMKNGKPILGICVGMQVMAEKGLEFGEFAGLGWVNGSVEMLKVDTDPLPHIGWNSVTPSGTSPLFANKNQEIDFYFVHSYALKNIPKENIIGVTSYGQETFCSAFQKDNIFGVQFHPEKSQKAGRYLFQNFLGIQ